MSEQNKPAGDPAMPVIAYLRADAQGDPVWTDDCVCQDPVFPGDPDGSDEDDVSMPMVRQSDALAALAAKDAEIAALTAERDALREDYKSACVLVAEMHEAAMGSVTGPVLGVVEDVAALRADAARYRWLRDEAGNEILQRLQEILVSDEWDCAVDSARCAATAQAVQS